MSDIQIPMHNQSSQIIMNQNQVIKSGNILLFVKQTRGPNRNISWSQRVIESNLRHIMLITNNAYFIIILGHIS